NDPRAPAGPEPWLEILRSGRFSLPCQHRQNAKRRPANRAGSLALVAQPAWADRTISDRKRECGSGLFRLKEGVSPISMCKRTGAVRLLARELRIDSESNSAEARTFHGPGSIKKSV